MPLLNPYSVCMESVLLKNLQIYEQGTGRQLRRYGEHKGIPKYQRDMLLKTSRCIG